MMQMHNYRLHIILLCFISIILFILDIMIGAVYIPVEEIVRSIFHTGNSATDIIVLQSRLPKALTAVIAGMALPAAGLMMQTFFKNPVAGPDILGITSGASLMVALVIMSSGGMLSAIIPAAGSVGIIIAGIVGAVLVLLLMLMVAQKLTDAVTLLIFGLMFGTAVSAVVGLLQFFSEKEALKLFVLWTFGSLSGVTWPQLAYLIPVVAITVLCVLILSKQLNLILLGDEYAKSLGLKVQHSRIIFISLTGVLTGSVTAFCGPIAFIGIAVPHIARIIFKTSSHFILMPASILIGISIMLLCDMISQMPGAGVVLPLNTVTALMGAPFVIYIIFKNNRMNRFFS